MATTTPPVQVTFITRTISRADCNDLTAEPISLACALEDMCPRHFADHVLDCNACASMIASYEDED